MFFIVAFGFVCLLALTVALVVRFLPPDRSSVGAGALVFALALPLLVLAGLIDLLLFDGRLTDLSRTQPNVMPGFLLVGVVGGALLQEALHFAVVKLFIQKLARLPSAIWFGIGFAGTELLFLALNAIVGGMTVILLPGHAAISEYAQGGGWMDVVAALVERIAAITLSIVSSYFVIAAAAFRRLSFFFVAVALHALVNLTGVFVSHDDLLSVLSLVSLCAVIGCVATTTLYRKVPWLR